MTLKFRHWLATGIIALAIHAGTAYAVFMTPKITQGAKAKGVGGLEVNLSMIASAIGAESQKESEEIEKKVEPVPQVEERVEETTEPAPEIEPHKEVVEEIRQEPIVKPEPIKETSIKRPVIEKPKEEFKPTKKPKLNKIVQILPKSKVKLKSKKPTPKKQVVKIKPQPTPKAIEKKIEPPKKTVEKETPPKEQRRATQLAYNSQGAVQNAPNANRADKATQQGGGRYVGKVNPDYITTLRRWLEKHKTYPKKAKRRRHQGVVYLALSVLRNGQIIKSHVKKGSGHKSLDLETIAMLERAKPLPKFPENMKGEVLRLVLPVQFSLR
jgi:periplasmic protein TonB